MPQATVISGLRYAVDGDAPNLPFHTNNLATDLDSLVCPVFPSAAVRDATINGAVLNSLPNHGEGLECSIIGSGKWEYDGAQWVPVGGPRTLVVLTATAGQTAGMAANNGVTYIAGINGSSPFTLRRRRSIEVVVNAVIGCDTGNSQYAVHVAEAAGEFLDWRDNIQIAGGPGTQRFKTRSEPIPMNPGTHGINCTVSLTSGGGIIAIGALVVTVLDVGPA